MSGKTFQWLDRYVSSAERKRLFSALLVVIGFITLMAVFGFIIVPSLRWQSHMALVHAIEGTEGQTGWLDPTDFPPAKKQIIPPIDPKTVMTPTPQLLARGHELFEQNCASCHGPKGDGNGPSGKSLNPPPRNFTQPNGWKNGTRVEDIYKTLDEGIKGSAMAAYKDLRRKDRMALVHYVQSLGSFDHGTSDPQAREALEKLFATSGEVIPNRIPVHEAMAKVAQEFHAAPALNTTDPIAREFVLDPSKAAQTLAGIQNWEASDADFIRGIVAGLPGNGFAPAVATCPPDRLTALRLALARK